MKLSTKDRHLAASLVAAVFTLYLAIAVRAVTAVSLPVEVVGEDGTTSSVTVDVPPGRAGDVRSLWMQIHGLSYADMVSVQVNRSAWFTLNNDTVTVAEPGRSFGGIGGGVTTLKVTLALPAGTAVAGANTVRFRFNRTDGVNSGFRVVAFNLLAADAAPILPPDAFTEEDPSTWAPPFGDPESLRAGRELWSSAELTESGLPGSPKIRAHCSDCHARDGRDLKYFNYSNASIAARSRFHGLSDLQGRQIASYVRALSSPSPGRPWNPPYQPGPGLDAQPVSSWAAGAGLSWALENDTATLPYLFGPSGVPAAQDAAIQPDGNLNPREIPISLQLPDWNHWLPRVHPLDAWGAAFQNSEFARSYDAPKQSLRRVLASPDLSTLISSGRIVTAFDDWTKARRTLLKPYVEGQGVQWSLDLTTKVYATQLWQLVKAWEMTQEFGLEGRGRELYGATGESRTWFNTIPAAAAPAIVNIPSDASGMGGSGLTNEYFNAAWYELQVLLNSGNHRHRDRGPVDWIYAIGRFHDLYGHSRRPEPARLLVALIKGMQSTDPGTGPENVLEGWRPNQVVDPMLIVNPAWAPMFEPLTADQKRAITESLLTAWLDKNQQYRVDRYFRGGLSEKSYAAPASYGRIAGGKPWEAAPLLIAAGVSPDLVRRLQNWGASYTETGARFLYAPPRNGAPPANGTQK